MLDLWNLSLREVSGLGMRRNPYSDLPEVLGVSDEDVRVAVAMVDKDGGLAVAEPHKVEGVDRHWAPTGKGSEWEGVAGDVSGRIFILREESSELLVITADFVLDRRLQLTHPWLDDTKKYGLESLLLLREGHVVCAKQRKPVTFIEFGPAGHSPIGVTPDSVLSSDDEFILSQDDNLAAIATWKMDEGYPLESVNDIAVDRDRTMLAISSKSRCIARLGYGLDPGHNHAKVTQRWELPKKMFKADDAKAEGLLADPRLGYLVAVDSHKNTPNLFCLNEVFEL